MGIPTLLELAVNGDSVALRYSEALGPILPSINRFVVMVNGRRVYATGAASLSADGTTIRFRLASSVAAGVSVTIAYGSVNGADKPGFGDLKSLASGQKAAFSRGAAASNVTGTAPPSVTITSSKATLQAGESATITFSFSRSPGSSFSWDGSSGDVSVSGGSLSALTASADPKVFTATFTPTAASSGTASITVAAGSYTDAFGNPGGPGLSPAIAFDTVPPTLAISSDKLSLQAGESATLTFTFSEVPSNFDATDINSTGGSVTALTASADPKVFTATFTPTAASSGTASITVAAGSYTDAFGNPGGPGLSPAIAFDTAGPAALTPAAPSITSLENDTGTPGDFLTAERRLVLLGSTEVNTTVELFRDGLSLGTTVAGADGSWRFVSPAGDLPDGTYGFTAIATRPGAPASSPASALRTIQVDGTPPDAPSASLATSSDTGTLGDAITSLPSVTLVGSGEAGAILQVDGLDRRVLIGADGRFSFPDLPLNEGDNDLVLRITDAAGNNATRALTLARTSPDPGSDPVLSWNQTALKTIKADAAVPTFATRALAMQSIAVLDTIAAIDGTAAYMVGLRAPTGIPAAIAVAAAAHRVLTKLFPYQTSALDAQLAADLAPVPAGEARDQAVAFGKSVADAILALREHDGWDTFITANGGTAAGQWRPTPPSFALAQTPQWGTLTPFSLSAGNQFRPGPPPSLSSDAYTTAFQETLSLGSATSTTRTSEQTAIARFWADGGGTYTPPGHWNDIADDLAASGNVLFSSAARLLAILNVALADSSIAAWDTKYAYTTWRPITAIREADLDGNANTSAVPDWQPLLVTPNHPEYVSGHSTYSAAAATVLTDWFGAIPFSTDSISLPGVTRSFTDFRAAAEEAGRSRIYAGIHFEFSNQVGQSLGDAVGRWVLDGFRTNADSRAPFVLLDQQNDGVLSMAPVLSGYALDNFSGLAGVDVSLNGSSSQRVAIDDRGRFSLDVAALFGPLGEGLHTLSLSASDAAGNTGAAPDHRFTIDTTAPTLQVTSLVDGANLASGARLSGSASGTGSSLKTLSYRFDGGVERPILFDPTTGAFDEPLSLGSLSIGAHQLTLTGRDSAGNLVSTSIQVNLPSTVPFTIHQVSPAAGAQDVGVTFRPQVTFTRPVDPATLTSSSFYATNTAGVRLSASVVVSPEGTSAWLFPDQALPGSSVIDLHLDGSLIQAAGDGVRLDADGDGSPGGLWQSSFVTVSRTAVPGTSLTGFVVGPGNDLKPMTFDDFRVGPDGAAHTDDDVFLDRLAGVKVYILGLENQAVYTDSQGRFTLNDVPSGVVKVAVDGRTATHAPSDMFYPEMVMDVTIRPGVANTLMGTMGSAAQQQENATRGEVYLPRIAANILTPISASAPTEVRTTVEGAPNLIEEDRSRILLVVQPNTVIGENGLPLANAQVGIATVPPELVRDMLPPGLLQHTFDLTIQAPGAAVFSTPVQLTLPNVFHAPPGTKLNLLSFDHTTGRLVIDGTGTVSADGLFVVTDPDSGITRPGWHGMTPPGGESDPPCDPTAPKTINIDPIVLTSGLEDRFYKDDDGSFTLSIGNNAAKPDPSKDPCEGDNGKATPLVVKIEVEGPASEFLTGLAPTQFELAPQQQKNIKVEIKDLLAGIQSVEKDILYGSKIKITGWKSSTPGTLLLNEDVYVYRWLDAADGSMTDLVAPHKDGILEFADTVMDGASGVMRSREVEQRVGSATPTFNLDSYAHFSGIGFPHSLVFDPTAVGATLDTTLRIKNPEGAEVGSLKLRGQGTPIINLNLDRPGLINTLATIVTDAQALGGNVHPGLFTPSEIELIDTPAEREAFADAVIAGVIDRFSPVSTGIQAGSGANAIKANWITELSLGSFGESSVPPPADGVDNGTQIGAFFANYTNYSQTVQNFLLSSLVLNQSFNTNIQISVDNHAEWSRSGQPHTLTASQFQNALILTTAHEAAHTLGAIHSAQVKGTGITTFEWQEVKLQGGAPGDTFTLSWLGQTTAPLARTASAATVKGALEALSTIGAGNVSVLTPAIPPGSPFSAHYQIAFQNDLVGPDMPQIAAAATGTMATAVSTMSNGASTVSANFSVPNGMTDIMYGGTLDLAGALRFQPGVTLETLKLGLHIDWNSSDAQKALALIIAHKAAAGAAGWFSGVDGDSASQIDAIPGAHLALLDDQGLLVSGNLNFGALLSDAPGLSKALRLVSFGTDSAQLNSLTLNSAGGGFTLVGAPGGPVTLAPGTTLDFSVVFDPTIAGPATGRLEIGSGNASGPTSLRLSGRGVSPLADMTLNFANNNIGGQDIAAGVRLSEDFAALTNTGSQTLTITGLHFVDGDATFSIAGLASPISDTNPHTLAPGESLNFDVAFDPGRIGLVRGTLAISSNDPETPVLNAYVVGTGTGPLASTLDYGNDYVVLEQVGRDQEALRTVSDSEGGWSFFLPPQQAVHYSIFDPVSGLISHGYDQTELSGQRTHLTGGIFMASTVNDTDGDGLPDDIERAIGTSPLRQDTNQDGLSDFDAIQSGRDPLGDSRLPIGVVASLNLPGDVQDLALASDLPGLGGLTALVALGFSGLGVVSLATPLNPRLISTLGFGRQSRSIAFDQQTGRAALAANDQLLIVDLTNPSEPSLQHSIAIPAQQVETLDGSAFVASGSEIRVYDLLTGEATGVTSAGGSIMGLAREGNYLYALIYGGQLNIFEISGLVLVSRGSTNISGQVNSYSDRKIYAADGILYVPASDGFSGGYATIDVSDPGSPAVISGPDITTIGGTAIALTGSGQGVIVGDPGGVFGANVLDLIDTRDPANTAANATRVTLSARPVDVAFAGGFAHVLTTGSSNALQVVNVIAPDLNGIAPTCTINSAGLDIDPLTPGIQVQEGSILSLRTTIRDDVLVNRVEVLVNGVITSADPTYPYDLRAALPSIEAAGGNEARVRVRVTDSAGNVGLSDQLTLQLTPDTVAPSIIDQNIREGDSVGRTFRTFRFTFSETVELTAAVEDVFRLLPPPNTLITGTTAVFRDNGRQVQLTVDQMDPGIGYRLELDTSKIRDGAGNVLGASVQTTTFAVSSYDTITYGTIGGDYLRGGEGRDLLSGGPKENPKDDYSYDSLEGFGGDDDLYGYGGWDYLSGGSGNDLLDVGAGGGYAEGGPGNDFLVGGDSGDNLYGGGGLDTFTGGAGDDSLSDGDGTYEEPIYNPANGHWYQLFTSYMSWREAQSFAASNSLSNRQGYLVTITDAEEQAFLNANFGFQQFWIGASDIDLEGTWSWVDGPEAGSVFYVQGQGIQPGYSNWNDGEPNNQGDEDFGQITYWSTWNDMPESTYYHLYTLVEYGGMSADATEPVNLPGDVFLAGEGDDYISSGGANDRVDGGDGLDRLDLNFRNQTQDQVLEIVDAAVAAPLGTSGYVIRVEQFYIAGGSGNDRFQTTDGSDNLDGRAGNDTLLAGGGYDYLYGGDGDDWLDLEAGGGNADGQSGDDKLYGGADPDFLQGGEGNDTLFGGGGSDVLYGGGGNNPDIGFAAAAIGGGGGATGPTGSDQLYGGDGGDALYGGGGIDLLDGGEGNDYLDDGDGLLDDAIYNPENGHWYRYVETYLPWSGALEYAASRRLSNRQGYLLTITSAEEQAFIAKAFQTSSKNLSWLAASDADGEGTWRWMAGPETGSTFFVQGLVDQPGFSNWGPGEPSSYGGEISAGLYYSDQWSDLSYYYYLPLIIEYGGMPGDGTNPVIQAGDTLSGGTGDDNINSKGLNDSIDGGEGSDRLDINVERYLEDIFLVLNDPTTVSFTGGGGAVVGVEKFTIRAGSGNDHITTGADNDTLYGGDGNDTLQGGGGIDALYGGDGNDQLILGNGGGYAYGEAGEDGLAGADGQDHLQGDAGNDTLHGGAGIDTLYGGAGDDFLDVGADGGTAYGEDGDDSLIGSDSADYLVGGTGQDSISAGAGNDYLSDGDSIFVDPIYNPGNNHWYELKSTALPWIPALGFAGLNAFSNRQGYMVTITSEEEQKFLEKAFASEQFWIAASDVDLDGTWTWSAGPESPEAFYIQGQLIQPGYSNWSTGEPNKGYQEYSAAWQSGGLWADIPHYYYLKVLVEYGGMAGDGSGPFLLPGDVLQGGGGDDTIMSVGLSDEIDGGDGYDNLDLNLTQQVQDLNLLFSDPTAVASFDLGGSVLAIERFHIRAGSGNDLIVTGDGDDHLEGFNGNDTLRGGAGSDALYGGDGDDYLDTGSGGGQADGQKGNDELVGGDDVDNLYGGDNNDTLWGGAGYDYLYGDTGNDQLHLEADGGSANGGAGNDVLTGSDTADYLSGGGGGQDHLSGGAGNDILQDEDNFTDEAIYNPSNQHWYQFLAIFQSRDEAQSAAASNQFFGRQGYLATITSADEKDFLTNAFGSQSFWLGASDLTANGTWRWTEGPEVDVVFYDHSLASQPGYSNWATSEPSGYGGEDYAIQLYNGFWHDTSQYNYYGVNTLIEYGGVAGDSALPVLQSGDSLLGGEGDDTITSHGVNDSIDGGEGFDRLSLNVSNQSIDLSLMLSDSTTLTTFGLGGSVVGVEQFVINSGSGSDTITTGLGSDMIHGGKGNDTLDGGDGNDTIYGEEGDDVLIGGLGYDWLSGGSGNDRFRYLLPDVEHADSIVDFEGSHDFVEVSAAGFGGGLASGMDLFAAGKYIENDTGLATAAAGVGQFIFNTNSNQLLWDSDGSGGQAAFQLAWLYVPQQDWTGSRLLVIQ